MILIYHYWEIDNVSIIWYENNSFALDSGLVHMEISRGQAIQAIISAKKRGALIKKH